VLSLVQGLIQRIVVVHSCHYTLAQVGMSVLFVWPCYLIHLHCMRIEVL